MPMHPEYRELWGRAGYGLKMGSAAVVPPPPAHLRRLYHLTSSDHGISDVAFGRIKVARFADLNDPFELLGVKFREHAVRGLVTDFKDKYGQQSGLLCFSKDWISPALWSHYGKRHTGICLGFDVPRDQVHEVNYEEDRDEVQPGTLQIDPILEHRLISTKSEHWSYEEEIRVIVSLNTAKQEGKLFFRPFDQDLVLREVILGPECSLDLFAVRALAHRLDPTIVVFKSRLADKWFSIVPLERTVP